MTRRYPLESLRRSRRHGVDAGVGEFASRAAESAEEEASLERITARRWSRE